MLVVLATLNNKIIFYKYFGEKKHSVAYLLAYSALDTEDPLSIDDFVSSTTLLESGHKIVTVHRTTDRDVSYKPGILSQFLGAKSKSKKTVDALTSMFVDEMLNPFVDCNSGLSEEFGKNIP
ncbi:uncharacterized protein VICG_00381 [Vittaforma corneae ATCC 50505]|uniref:Uncharacterized protein n=1 Tax=Vittaforma corneae (strain ATCC 50505) TaxID=993615 RepID=L2GPW3_VITCO|nr:uncharacterized protein VICG_00381 [Vittaforma corneae ATCC 50505]ELA42629.1 hypothetical protein VICG_00381 [Vittaforma corneae ATCC 50505]